MRSRESDNEEARGIEGIAAPRACLVQILRTPNFQLNHSRLTAGQRARLKPDVTSSFLLLSRDTSTRYKYFQPSRLRTYACARGSRRVSSGQRSASAVLKLKEAGDKDECAQGREEQEASNRSPDRSLVECPRETLRLALVEDL